MRVYPSGYRLTSKNFDPIPYWKKGIQFVALNWQTNDVALQLNEAMFDSRIGYVLKPSNLLPSASSWFSKLKNRLNLEEVQLLSFEFTIISAQQLPRPKGLKSEESFDPYVEIEVFLCDSGLPSSSSFFFTSSSSSSSVSSSSSKKRSLPGSAFTEFKWRSPCVIDNGFNPIWNSSWQVQINRDDYHFVFVRFSVHSGENVFAVYTARLRNFRSRFL